MPYDLIIIGAGPAGLSAAIYVARKKLNTIILTENVGGQSLLAATIENYLGIKAISGVNLIQPMPPLFKDKDVAVIGGGNADLDAALDLTKYANKIYVLEFGMKIIGDELTQEKLKETGKVEFITDAATKEIRGKNFVEGLVYTDRKIGEEKELKVGGVFINIGQIPSSDFIKGFLGLNPKKEIMIDHITNETSIEGVYAAGDITDIPHKQCVVAAGEGAKAALSVYNYLVKGSLTS